MRFYGSATGRFLSEDPLRFSAGDVNLYRFVGNSVPNLVDISGEQSGIPPFPLPPGFPFPGPWKPADVLKLLATHKVGIQALSTYALGSTNGMLSVVVVPTPGNWGQTHTLRNGSKLVRIDPQQNLLDAAATFIHEMAHVAYGPAGGEYMPILLELQFYAAISTKFGINLLPAQYRVASPSLMNYDVNKKKFVVNPLAVGLLARPSH